MGFKLKMPKLKAPALPGNPLSVVNSLGGNPLGGLVGGAGKIPGVTNFLSETPIIGGFFDNSDQKAIDQVKGGLANWQQLGAPNLKWTDYNPDAFTPTDAAYSTVSEDPQIRMKQLETLGRFEEMSKQGLSPEDELGYLRARQAGSQLAKGRTDAAIADAQARGVAGGGQEFAMREIANQAGAQRAQEAAMQQAADAAKQRQAYLNAYAGQLSNQRSQDFGANQANADIINRFNMANTQARNQAGQAFTNDRNEAKRYNNEGRINTQQQNFNNQVTRLNGMTGANTQVANAYAAQNAARTDSRNKKTGQAMDMLTGAMGGGF